MTIAPLMRICVSMAARGLLRELMPLVTNFLNCLGHIPQDFIGIEPGHSFLDTPDGGSGRFLLALDLLKILKEIITA